MVNWVGSVAVRACKPKEPGNECEVHLDTTRPTRVKV